MHLPVVVVAVRELSEPPSPSPSPICVRRNVPRRPVKITNAASVLTESVSTRGDDDIELRAGFYVSSIGFVFFFFFVSFLITVRPPAIHVYKESRKTSGSRKTTTPSGCGSNAAGKDRTLARSVAVEKYKCLKSAFLKWRAVNGVFVEWEGGTDGENRTLPSIIPSEPSSRVSLSIRFPRMSHGNMQ